jgi:hypothetical protein
MVAAGAGAAIVVESITCFTPSCLRRDALRGESRGVEAFSKGSEYILA